MAPKVPVKRRSESEHDRAQKKGGKAEPTYDTYDDAFDGGVAQEEQGERYKDGEKVWQLRVWLTPGPAVLRKGS